jgi:hypothetical protein
MLHRKILVVTHKASKEKKNKIFPYPFIIKFIFEQIKGKINCPSLPQFNFTLLLKKRVKF